MTRKKAIKILTEIMSEEALWVKDMEDAFFLAIQALSQKEVNITDIQNIIDIWIDANQLGNYDKVPKIKEYDRLAQALKQRFLITHK